MITSVHLARSRARNGNQEPSTKCTSVRGLRHGWEALVARGMIALPALRRPQRETRERRSPHPRYERQVELTIVRRHWRHAGSCISIRTCNALYSAFSELSKSSYRFGCYHRSRPMRTRWHVC
jgi:hypothetical protein